MPAAAAANTSSAETPEQVSRLAVDPSPLLGGLLQVRHGDTLPFVALLLPLFQRLVPLLVFLQAGATGGKASGPAAPSRTHPPRGVQF